jgi:hypothetical protein
MATTTLVGRGAAPHLNEPVGQLDCIPYYTCCYQGFPPQEAVLPDDDYSTERRRAMECLCKDGVKPMTKEEQDAERVLNWRLIKMFTMAIFTMDITRVSFPVGYNEQRTFMERAGDLFAFLVCDWLDRAHATHVPEQRLATVTVGIIAGFHIYLQSKKPWNPVLGETYVGQWENGATMYGEQVSHHPPRTAIQVRSPTQHWWIESQFCFEMDRGMLQIDVLQRGVTTLHFDDGTVYQWEFPMIRAVGLLRGDRIVRVVGPLVVKDLTNRIESIIHVGPKNSRRRGILHSAATTIWGGVARAGANADEFLVRITGDYCGALCIDDRQVWRLDSCFARRPSAKIEAEDMLLSDARYRIDRAMLIQRGEGDAEAAKKLLEELQRRDARQRTLVATK